MCADVVVRTDSSSGLAVGSRARADSLSVGAATSARGRPSLEEGAARHERERRADETSGRAAHDEPVDNDGLRVQRWANLASTASAVTNCFQHDQIVSSGRDFHSWRGRGFFQCLSRLDFSKNFWKHAEWRRGILERDGRAVLVI